MGIENIDILIDDGDYCEGLGWRDGRWRSRHPKCEFQNDHIAHTVGKNPNDKPSITIEKRPRIIEGPV